MATQSRAPVTKMRQRRKISTPEIAERLEAELAELSNQSLSQLRDTWKAELQSDPPPIQSRDVLLGLFAWRIQEIAVGGLDAGTERQLSAIADATERDPQYQPQCRLSLSPGIVLTRAWKGVIHRVSVTDGGFRYSDRDYKSLSEVARTITGTRWSGPRFFGLEQ